MSTETLSRIEPVSLGKWTAAFSVIVSALMILMYLPFLIAGLFFTEIAASGIVAALIGGAVFVVMGVLMYAVFGFVMGFVTAYFFNWYADRFGGLELEFE